MLASIWRQPIHEYEGAQQCLVVVEEKAARGTRGKSWRRAAQILLDEIKYRRRHSKAVSSLASSLEDHYGRLWDRFLPGAFHAHRAVVELEGESNESESAGGWALAVFAFLVLKALAIPIIDGEISLTILGTVAGAGALAILVVVAWRYWR